MLDANKTTQISYHYHDENRNILFTKKRIEHNGAKDFRFERIENGITIPNAQGVRKVLYNLPDVQYGISKEQPIFLVEGEKDVHTLLNNTIFATTAPGTLEWDDAYTQTLANADIVILFDYDTTGIKRRDLLCSKLYGNVKRLRVVELPGLELREKHGEDITDWLAMGNTLDYFKELVASTPDYAPPPQQPSGRLRIISTEELFALQLPEREMLLSPFLPNQGLVLLVAKRGIGKTHVALGIAYAVATGGTFLNWSAPKEKKVLYIDGEMPAVLMQERMKIIAGMMNKIAKPGFFQLLTPDLQEQVMPDLSLKEDRDLIDEYVKDIDLIVVDNISCLFRSGSENEAESWQEAQEWALDLRRRGKSVLFVHHAGKNGVQRGTSKREDILDTVIILRHPDGYKPQDGAKFEIHFDKARHFAGEDATSFQAHLTEINGAWDWILSDDPNEEQVIRIAQLKKEGCTIKEMQKNTGLTKSQVETKLKKAKEKGLLE